MPQLSEIAKGIGKLGKKFDITPPPPMTTGKKQTGETGKNEVKSASKITWGKPIEFRHVLAKVPKDTKNPLTGISSMRVVEKYNFTLEDGTSVCVPVHFVNGMHIDGVNSDGEEVVVFLNRHYFELEPEDFGKQRVFRVVYRTKTIEDDKNIRKFTVLDLHKETEQAPRLVMRFPKADDHPTGSTKSLPIFPLTNRQVHFCTYVPPKKKEEKK